MQDHLIWAVVNGIGTTKFVFSARRDGFLMRTKYASLSAINVKHGILQDYARLVSKDTT